MTNETDGSRSNLPIPYRFSGLGRGIDPKNSYHRILGALAGAAAFGLGGLELSGGGSHWDSARAGLLAAFFLFGGWALGREILPDSPRWAFATGLAALGAAARFPAANPWLLLLALLAIRLVNRSPGRSPTLVDRVILAAGGMLLTIWLEQPLVWVGVGVALVLDGLLAPRARTALVVALPASVGGVVYDLQNPELMRELAFLALPPWAVWLAAIAGLYAVGLLILPHPRSGGDVGRAPLRSSRVRAGACLLPLFAALPLFGGYYGLRLASPLWAVCAMAIVGLSLSRVPRRDR